MLVSIKTLKTYCKATLSVFFVIDDDKKFLYDTFFVSNCNFTA